MKMIHAATALAFVFAAALPPSAVAHKMWIVPSATVLSGNDAWVTVDAAISNDLYYADHFPAPMDRIEITAPDGAAVAPENAATGKFRSTFDLHLNRPGTYRIALRNDGVSANYTLAGEKKRWRGQAGELAGAIPAAATELKVSESVSRVESFVTAGATSQGVFKPTNRGLELAPVTHPNDLASGEKATFRLLLDGKPASGIKVTAIAGATRYRDTAGELTATTDTEGSFSFTWPAAGMYWMNASTEDGKTSVKQASQRRLAYTATLEVLPQ
jgi:uncharacterized GH25 family protein